MDFILFFSSSIVPDFLRKVQLFVFPQPSFLDSGFLISIFEPFDVRMFLAALGNLGVVLTF